VVGVLGILLLAKQQGFVAQMRPLIERLQREIDFHMAPQLVSQILGSAGE
jgi:predicted nucleic acid-binding protein